MNGTSCSVRIQKNPMTHDDMAVGVRFNLEMPKSWTAAAESIVANIPYFIINQYFTIYIDNRSIIILSDF